MLANSTTITTMELTMKTNDPYEVCVMGEHTNEFYGRPEEDDRVYTDPATMAWLLRQEHILECLMKCGVHNSDAYDDAMKMHKETYV